MKKLLFVLTIAFFTNMISAGPNLLGYQGKGDKCETKNRNFFSSGFWTQGTSQTCAQGLSCRDGICQ